MHRAKERKSIETVPTSAVLVYKPPKQLNRNRETFSCGHFILAKARGVTGPERAANEASEKAEKISIDR
jgi:hypothetical protein